MEVIKLITLFLFIVSLIYNLNEGLKLFMNIKQENPEQIEYSIVNKIALLLSISYIITYIISLFN